MTAWLLRVTLALTIDAAFLVTWQTLRRIGPNV